jgi:hypothetical protein
VFFAVKILNPSNPVNPVKKLPVGLFPEPRAAGLSITSMEIREANTLVPYCVIALFREANTLVPY